MTSELETAPTAEQPAEAPSPRLWLPMMLLGAFWVAYLPWRFTDLGVAFGFQGFLVVLAVGALASLTFIIRWLASGRVGGIGERLLVFAAFLVAAVGAGALSLVGPFLFFPGLPFVLGAWTLALFATRRRAPRARRPVLLAVIVACWGSFLVLRSDGSAGDGQPIIRWRWQPTAEEIYLADAAGERAAMPATPAPSAPILVAGADDWPGFRGAARDGVRTGVRIATDWDAAPPRLVWRRRIGPAWSSVAVVGDRLYTQEQVGEREAVVCLDATTGATVWSREDAVRHDDGWAGPARATPTFADGVVFAQGATGILSCLDAASGERRWSRDIRADAGVEVPVFGFSSSPLVVGDVVIAFSGGESRKTLLAYRTADGEPVWTAAAGKSSYASPQLAAIDGVEQALLASDEGIFAVDPASGALLWERRPTDGWGGPMPCSIQPRLVGPAELLVDGGQSVGVRRIAVARQGESWTSDEKWVSRRLKAGFNDFVTHDGAIYGFDGRIFTCIDLATGERLWKAGRYGSGQVLLLADQPALLIVSESGEVVLLAADRTEHRELGRFQGIEGKTWNHPVVARDRLYVRNAEEIACYELRLAEPR